MGCQEIDRGRKEEKKRGELHKLPYTEIVNPELLGIL